MASLLDYGSDSSDSASESSAPSPKRPRHGTAPSANGVEDSPPPVAAGATDALEAPVALAPALECSAPPQRADPAPAQPEERPLPPPMRIPEQMREHLQRLGSAGRLQPGALTAEVVDGDDFWRPSAGRAALAALGVDPDAAALDPLSGQLEPVRLPLRSSMRAAEASRSRLRSQMQQSWAKQAPLAGATAPLSGPGGPFAVAAPAPVARSAAPAVPPAVAVARAKAVAAARAAAAAVAKRAVARAAAAAQK